MRRDNFLRVALIFAVLGLLGAGQGVSAAAISDEELIVCAVSTSYPKVDFGARVGLCALILHRVEAEGFPDTVAGVIHAENSGFDGTILTSAADEKVQRMTRDAYRAACCGADPTGGLLYFEELPKPARGENRAAFERSLALSDYRVVIGGIGFY